jgi:hypothetical protein
MKKLLAFASAIALSFMVLGAHAQKPSKMTGKMAMPNGAKAQPAKGVTGTSKGVVKGAPTATGFVLTTAKGDQTVDITGAKIRNASGQFVKTDQVTDGAPAEVTGTWKGRTLYATSVKLTAMKSSKPAGGKMGAKGKKGTPLPK